MKMQVSNLRISVTNNCNYNCNYCHNEGNTCNKDISVEDINKISKAAIVEGIKDFKITGGEPLLHRQIIEIVKTIKQNGADHISMVTNGKFLPDYAKKLKEAGLDRVNVGCDSTSEKIQKNTASIIPAILSAKKNNLIPIKINMVVEKSNYSEIKKIMNFAKENSCTLQLIELMNTDKHYYDQNFISLAEFEKEIEQNSEKVSIREVQNRKKIDINGCKIEFVRQNKTFCEGCNKIRITNDCKVKHCMMRDDKINFEGVNSIREAIASKRNYYD